MTEATVIPALPGYYAVFTWKVPPYDDRVLYPIHAWYRGPHGLEALAWGIPPEDVDHILCPDGRVISHGRAGAAEWPNLEAFLESQERAYWSVKQVLEPGGRWLVQSDHVEYFGIIRELLGGHPSLCEIAWDDAGVDPGPDWQGTNFEIKYAREQLEIFKVAYLRR